MAILEPEKLKECKDFMKLPIALDSCSAKHLTDMIKLIVIVRLSEVTEYFKPHIADMVYDQFAKGFWESPAREWVNGNSI